MQYAKTREYMHALNWFQTDEQIFQAMRKSTLRRF